MFHANPIIARLARVMFRAAPLLGLSLALLASARAGEPPTPTTVKVAYLYNFAKFVTWPAHSGPPDGQFRICIYADAAFFAVAAKLGGKRIGERQIVVSRCAPPDDVSKCHLLFVQGATGRLPAGLRAWVGGRPVLTVGDGRGFVARGGMIELKRVGAAIRFTIDKHAAHRVGLRISSRLLRLSYRERH